MNEAIKALVELTNELQEFIEQISLTPGSDWDGAREPILESCHGFLDKIPTAIEALREDEDAGYVMGLEAALKACDAHVQRHHSSGSWWNDPVVYALKRNIIDPALAAATTERILQYRDEVLEEAAQVAAGAYKRGHVSGHMEEECEPDNIAAAIRSLKVNSND